MYRVESARDPEDPRLGIILPSLGKEECHDSAL